MDTYTTSRTAKRKAPEAVRIFSLLLLPFLTGVCTTQRWTPAGPSVPAPESFRQHCMHFLSQEFGPQVAGGLRGRVWSSTEGEPWPLPGAQIAAQRLDDGRLSYALSGTDGSFSVDSLPPGEYEVWTCLDGFDEVRFRLRVDQKSSTVGFDLYLAPSETGGRHEVVPLEADSRMP